MRLADAPVTIEEINDHQNEWHRVAGAIEAGDVL